MAKAKAPARGVHALFQSIGDDGTTWRFIIQADDTWSITRDGVHVEVRAADRTGIGTGVRKFLQLAGMGQSKTAATRNTLETQRKGK